MKEKQDKDRAYGASLVSLVGAVVGSVLLVWLAQLVYPYTAGLFSVFHLSWVKAAYLLCLTGVPLVIWYSYTMGERWLGKIKVGKISKLNFLMVLGITAGIVWYVTQVDWSFYYQWAPDQLMTYLSPKTYVLMILLLGVCWIGSKWWWVKGLVISTMVGVSAYLANYVIINDLHRYNASALNLSVVMHSVVQVFFGKAVLIDQKSQYGLYAHFLEPILHLMGGVSVYNFSLLMASLVFVSMLFVGVFLWLVLKNKWIALTGFLATLYFNYFVGQMWPEELYLQYYPIRTLFPTLLLPLYYWYRINPNKIKYWFLWILFAGGILWNLDVGIFAFLSLLGVHLYRVLGKEIELREKMQEIVVLCGHSLMALILVFETFFVYEYYRYGAWPQMSELFSAQILFLNESVPQLYSQWILVGLIYLMGAIFAVGKLFHKDKSIDGEWAVLITVMGSGIFTYYLNNPHHSVLTNCGYPAIILLTFLVDRALRERQTRFPAWVGLVILSFMAASFVQNIRYSRLVGDTTTIQDLISPDINSAKSLWTIQKDCQTCVDFVYEGDYARDRGLKPVWVKKAEYTTAYSLSNGQVRDDILILSNWDYLLYLSAHARAPLAMVNFHHLYLENEWEELFSQIANQQNRYIIVDEEQLMAIGAEKSHPQEKIERIWKLIRANYHEVRRETVGDEYYSWRWNTNDLSTWEKNGL